MDKLFDVLSFGMLYCDISIKPVPKDFATRLLNDKLDSHIGVGGDALNSAMVASIVGGKVAVAGILGEDLLGKFVLHQMQERGLDISGVKMLEGGVTASAYHLIEADGTNHVLETDSSQKNLTENDISDELLASAKVLGFGSMFFFPFMDKGGLERLFKRAHHLGVTTASDTFKYLPYSSGKEAFDTIESALYETDIFIPSIDEIAWLFDGERDVWKLAKKMEPYGMKVFGVKLGAEGSFLTDFKTAYKIGACQDIVVKDTNGCGDSFFGSFLYGYSQQWDLKKCGVLATVVSGHNAGAIGAVTGVIDCDSAIKYAESHPLLIDIFEYAEA
jgi:sugar/nucleoside kinase (ribokinase family)